MTPYGFPQYVIDRVMAKRCRLNVFDRFEPRTRSVAAGNGVARGGITQPAPVVE